MLEKYKKYIVYRKKQKENEQQKKITEESMMAQRFMFETCSQHLEMKLYKMGKLYSFWPELPVRYQIDNVSWQRDLSRHLDKQV